MITFACKKIEREELVRCSFNLNKTEYNVMMFLLAKRRIYMVSKIAKEMGLDRTTVQKSIKNLLRNKIIKRTQKNMPTGGYSYLYEINDRDEIKNKMKKIIYEWYRAVEKEITRL